jgi:hypothetical protein
MDFAENGILRILLCKSAFIYYVLLYGALNNFIGSMERIEDLLVFIVQSGNEIFLALAYFSLSDILETSDWLTVCSGFTEVILASFTFICTFCCAT